MKSKKITRAVWKKEGVHRMMVEYDDGTKGELFTVCEAKNRFDSSLLIGLTVREALDYHDRYILNR